MAKYIDADTVVSMPFLDDSYGIEKHTVETDGEWMSVPEMWGAFDIRYYCSECGKDTIINNSERYVLSDYCPHCGAIMNVKE